MRAPLVCCGPHCREPPARGATYLTGAFDGRPGHPGLRAGSRHPVVQEWPLRVMSEGGEFVPFQEAMKPKASFPPAGTVLL